MSGSLIVTILLATALGAAAQTFEITSTPFQVHQNLAADAGWHAYALTARTEEKVAYSMAVTTADACAILLFVKGHDLGPTGQYFATYSERNCVPRYSNTFPVDAADGTDFTVLIETTSPGDVNYSLEVHILTPVLSRATAGLLIVLTIAVLPPSLWVLRGRRANPKAPSAELPPPPPPPPPAT